MKESHLRSVIKAVSWRIFGTFSTMLIAFMITHEVNISLYIGLFEFVSKVALFYFHERLWNVISFGSSKTNANNVIEMSSNLLNQQTRKAD